MPDLKLHQERLPGGIAYIEAEGFLDAHTFEEMENLISSIFRQNVFKLVVKLEKLDYISSAGAGVFVGATIACRLFAASAASMPCGPASCGPRTSACS